MICVVLLPEENLQKQTSGVQVEVYQVGVCLVSLLVVTFSIIILWKNKYDVCFLSEKSV